MLNRAPTLEALYSCCCASWKNYAGSGITPNVVNSMPRSSRCRPNDSGRAELYSLQQQRDELAGAVAPAFTGLSVEGKRLVNTATLAYAQQLLERLGAEGVAMLAKDASFKRVMDVEYGPPDECRLWMTRLLVALRLLQERPRDLLHLKQVTQRVRSNAFYRSNHDTVPVPETIGTVVVRTPAARGNRTAGHQKKSMYCWTTGICIQCCCIDSCPPA
jgi:hypothetical protein